MEAVDFSLLFFMVSTPQIDLLSAQWLSAGVIRFMQIGKCNHTVLL